jgi:hypothetical protein
LISGTERQHTAAETQSLRQTGSARKMEERHPDYYALRAEAVSR